MIRVILNVQPTHIKYHVENRHLPEGGGYEDIK